MDTGLDGNGYAEIVDMGAYEFGAGAPCPADLNGDMQVTVDDLLIVLSNWNGGAGGDVNGDGQTNVDDLLIILSSWGPCP